MKVVMRSKTARSEPLEKGFNRFAKALMDVRLAIERNLIEVFERHEFPRTFPVLILGCSHDTCGSLYIAGANPQALCPDCGGQPR
jgi:hypothetical protein